MPNYLADENIDMIQKKTLVIPTPALDRYESHYGDMVEMKLLSILSSVCLTPIIWTSKHMNNIMEMGDCLYHKIVQKRVNVALTEIPSEVKLDAFSVTMQTKTGSILSGYLADQETPDNTYSLQDAIQVSSENCPGCVLTTCGYSFAILNIPHKLIFMDFHSRGDDGLSKTSDGTAVTMLFSSVQDMANHIRK